MAKRIYKQFLLEMAEMEDLADLLNATPEDRKTTVCCSKILTQLQLEHLENLIGPGRELKICKTGGEMRLLILPRRSAILISWAGAG